jgi:polyketide cyclase/dehydrase/lipid transport protein
MGKRVEFSVSAATTADPDAVWSLLADGTTWPTWSPIGSFTLEKEGASGGESVGAIRVFKTGRTRNREELLELSPGRCLRYTALSGLPVRRHEARVDLTASPTGTTITWHEAFETTRPGTGWLLEKLLKRFVQRCATGLAENATASIVRA